jgi:hypothetical protein
MNSNKNNSIPDIFSRKITVKSIKKHAGNNFHLSRDEIRLAGNSFHL